LQGQTRGYFEQILDGDGLEDVGGGTQLIGGGEARVLIGGGEHYCRDGTGAGVGFDAAQDFKAVHFGQV
jgi:hypothetical protein